jgi:ubiquinone/menaquinone biosynthesis C-methylase UbiE
MCDSKTSSHKLLGRRLNQSQGFFPSKKRGISTTIFKCTVCGLIYANPLPIPLDLQDHYGVPPEEYWKKEYFILDENYFREGIESFKRLQAFQPGMKALDIGAGLGKQMKALEKAGFEVYGFEASRPFYERAISQMNISPEKLKYGMLEEMEYPSEFFDFISFGAVLEHLYDPSRSIMRALNWLKPSGLIHIEVPSSRWLINNMINKVYSLTLKDYVGNISPMHEPYHLYEFSLESFKLNGEKNNYSIAHHEYYVCDTYLPSFLDRIASEIMKRTETGMQLTVWLRKSSQRTEEKSQKM